MTTTEVEQFKQMTHSEVIKKYHRMLINGSITKPKYEEVLRAHQKLTCHAKTANGLLHDHEGGTTPAAAPLESLSPRPLPPSSASNEGESRESLPLQGGGTSHTDPKRGISQKSRLLNLLNDRNWHDTMEIAREVYGYAHGGIYRVAARIFDIKKDGHQIESKKVSKTIYAYRLI